MKAIPKAVTVAAVAAILLNGCTVRLGKPAAASAPVPPPPPVASSPAAGQAPAAPVTAPPVATPPPPENAKPVDITATPAEPPKPHGAAWEIRPDTTLRDTLAGWTARAGYQLAWNAAEASRPLDWDIAAADSLEGSFTDAVLTLLSGFRGPGLRPVGTIHSNRVLEITAE